MISKLDYAYQPIVNIHTGVTFGFEALLRGTKDAGYKSISEVFDIAYRDNYLAELDAILLGAAFTKLYSNSVFNAAKLFYNLDNRLLFNQASVIELPELSKTDKVYSSNICFELSEKHEIHPHQETHSLLLSYKENNYRIAIDDFGTGYSGLTLLYNSDPDYIKIDRFFIENINDDSRKKFFVANVVNLAHMMGIAVIAEGIETDAEFYVCREIGCDYAQGYLIQKPQIDIQQLSLKYGIVEKLTKAQSRKTEGDRNSIKREMTTVKAVNISNSTESILERFRNEGNVQAFPVVNDDNEPLGLLLESVLKKYVFSPYGISILQHKSSNEGIESLLSRAPVMEISSPIEKILDLFSLNQQLESVIITENGRYIGVLNSAAILRILSEKKISIAQDQNPLTKLPGNSSINGYLAEILQKDCCGHIIAYFDLDNFKPFNDVYGFRQGDRIIRLFADILREHRLLAKEFIGHIGGDDFFIGYSIKNYKKEQVLEEIGSIIQRFSNDVLPFYREKERETGYLTTKGRSGKKANFPLMTVSAAVISIDGSPESISMEELSEKIAEYKLKAKKSKQHIAILEMELSA